jgi:hypothetical protein
MARLKAHVLGVMLPLGDRVRQRPLNMGQHKLIPEQLVLVVQQRLQKRRQMIDALMERIAAGKHVGRAYKRRELKLDAARKPRRGPAGKTPAAAHFRLGLAHGPGPRPAQNPAGRPQRALGPTFATTAGRRMTAGKPSLLYYDITIRTSPRKFTRAHIGG